MAKKPNITQVNSLDGITTVINTNFNNVADAFDNTLSRDGSTPNQMEADIDMNSNDLLNVGSIDTNSLRLNGEAVSTELQAFATDIKYSFDYVSSLLSDERTYKYFAEGDIVEAEGFRYKVAPSTATDHHLTTAGGVKLHRLYDVKSEFKSITRPDSFAVAAGAAGGLTGSYTWAMTYVDSEGNETEPSPRIGPVALASQQASLTGLPVSADPRVVARRIYRTVANPSDILFLNLVAEIDNVATSYTDDLADVSLGHRHGVDQIQQPVALLDGAAGQGQLIDAGGCTGNADFRHTANPRHRAFQIMGDIVAHLTHTDNQPFDAVQHLVEGHRQPVNLLMTGHDWHPTTKVRFGNLPGSAGDRFHAGKGTPGHEPSHQDCGQNQRRHGDEENLLENGDKSRVVLHGIAQLRNDALADDPVGNANAIRPAGNGQRFIDP